MCFSQEMSGGFALLGLAMTFGLYAYNRNMQLALGAFYFCLMETLQYFQYDVIDKCDDKYNQFLTFLGFLHICFQPYFTHLMASSMTEKSKDLHQFMTILRMCVIGGFIILSRYALVEMYPGKPVGPNTACGPSTEWLRGEQLCTYRGKHHLAWSVPMMDVTYYVPGAALHSFLMFVPFLLTKFSMAILGAFLFFTGPVFAGYMTENLQEQASIWCLFSICQIIGLIVIFSIGDESARDHRTGGSLGMTFDKKTITRSRIKFFLLWPVDVIETKYEGKRAERLRNKMAKANGKAKAN